MSQREVYGDPLKYRLAAEYWRMTDDLMPKILSGLAYVSEVRTINNDWVETLEEIATASLDLQFAIVGFSMMLTKDDADSIPTFDSSFALALRRPDRRTITPNVMEGRAESFAKRRLSIEDRAMALYLQLQGVRGVAFKNKFWDQNRKPGEAEHRV